MYTISKEFHFSASHQLTGLAKEHPCARLHGHNYKAIFYFSQSQLDEVGFVIDYRVLDAIKQYIDAELDHKHLNDVFPFNPTSENIAFSLYQQFKKIYTSLKAVEILETEKTRARYEGE